MLERIDHVAIVLRDIDRSLPYYRERLQLPLVHDELLPEIGVRLAYLDAGNLFLQLVQPTTSSTLTRFLEERGEGLHHICFGVQKISETLSALNLESAADIFLGGRGRLCAFLAHPPDSIQIELTENQPYSALLVPGKSDE